MRSSIAIGFALLAALAACQDQPTAVLAGSRQSNNARGSHGSAPAKCGGVPSFTTALTIGTIAIVLEPAATTLSAGDAVLLTVTNQAGIAVPACAVTWLSSNVAVATIAASGTVTGLADGSAVISATVTFPGNGSKRDVHATASVTVLGQVASLTLTPETATLAIGATETFVPVLKDANGSVLTGREVTWSSSNTAVASVDIGGVATAIAAGTATITATSEGRSAGAVLTVVNPVTWVGVGGPYACALRAGGEAYCWGELPSREYLATPTRITPSMRWRSLVTGYSTICGIALDRHGYCWGTNRFGQIGNGTPPADDAFASPQLLAGGLTWDEIVTGVYSACGTNHPTRQLYCWGGVGTAAGFERNPAPVSSIAPLAIASSIPLSKLTSGSAHICGVSATHDSFCLGEMGGAYFDTPTPISAPEAIAGTFAVGMAETCSVGLGGTAYCFGYNPLGKLTSGDLSNGEMIAASNPALLAGGIHWSRFFSSPTFHSCGISTTGVGYCWGTNGSGQVGDASPSAMQATPSALPGEWMMLAPGLGIYGWGNRDFTCGLTVARDVLCWGHGEEGQLGNGTRTSSLTPLMVNIPQ